MLKFQWKYVFKDTAHLLEMSVFVFALQDIAINVHVALCITFFDHLEYEYKNGFSFYIIIIPLYSNDTGSWNLSPW